MVWILLAKAAHSSSRGAKKELKFFSWWELGMTPMQIRFSRCIWISGGRLRFWRIIEVAEGPVHFQLNKRNQLTVRKNAKSCLPVKYLWLCSTSSITIFQLSKVWYHALLKCPVSGPLDDGKRSGTRVFVLFWYFGKMLRVREWGECS